MWLQVPGNISALHIPQYRSCDPSIGSGVCPERFTEFSVSAFTSFFLSLWPFHSLHMSFCPLSLKVLLSEVERSVIKDIYVDKGTCLLLPIENETRVMPSVDATLNTRL